MKKLITSDIIEQLGLEVLNLEFADLKRPVDQPSISRRGLELSGAYTTNYYNQTVIGWGTKEWSWLSGLNETHVSEALSRVLSDRTPLLIISTGIKGRVFDQILGFCNNLAIPIIQVQGHLSNAISTIGGYIGKKLSPTQDIHGSLVNIHGVGVLIIGPSGIGKSEAVLELIQDEHLFISDDTVVVTQVGSEFIGEGAKITKGYLEARGIGLIDIQHMYGAKTVKDDSPINLVVELVDASKLNDVDRLGNRNLTYRILRGYLPLIKIPVNSGRNIASLIKAATSAYIAKQQGMDPLSEIAKRSQE